MKNYLICVTQKVEKFIGIEAKNEKECREKVVKQISNGEIDFSNPEHDEVSYELAEIYSKSLEKKLRKVLGKIVEEKNEKFIKLTEELIGKNKKENIFHLMKLYTNDIPNKH